MLSGLGNFCGAVLRAMVAPRDVKTYDETMAAASCPICEKGLEVGDKLVQLHPSGASHYHHVSCSEGLFGRKRVCVICIPQELFHARIDGLIGSHLKGIGSPALSRAIEVIQRGKSSDGKRVARELLAEIKGHYRSGLVGTMDSLLDLKDGISDFATMVKMWPVAIVADSIGFEVFKSTGKGRLVRTVLPGQSDNQVKLERAQTALCELWGHLSHRYKSFFDQMADVLSNKGQGGVIIHLLPFSNLLSILAATPTAMQSAIRLAQAFLSPDNRRVKGGDLVIGDWSSHPEVAVAIDLAELVRRGAQGGVKPYELGMVAPYEIQLWRAYETKAIELARDIQSDLRFQRICHGADKKLYERVSVKGSCSFPSLTSALALRALSSQQKGRVLRWAENNYRMRGKREVARVVRWSKGINLVEQVFYLAIISWLTSALLQICMSWNREEV